MIRYNRCGNNPLSRYYNGKINNNCNIFGKILPVYFNFIQESSVPVDASVFLNFFHSENT